MTFEAGTVRAFANICRHRGHELLADGGEQRRAGRWSARTTAGPTIWTAGCGPRRGWGAELDPGGFGLVELPAVGWHGWVFVNATGDAPPFSVHLGDLAGAGRAVPAGAAGRQRDAPYEVAANWKVIVENYHECYHCPLIHPELCRCPRRLRRQLGPARAPGSAARWTCASTPRRCRWTGAAHGVRSRRGARRAPSGTSALFPNLLISAHPDYVMTHRLRRRSRRRGRSSSARGSSPRAVSIPRTRSTSGTSPTARTGRRASRSSAALASPHFRPGPLAPNETAIYDWVTMLARRYSGLDG